MNEFRKHVIRGLSGKPKKLSSRYFYDERGDALFQRIMKLEEYYLPEFEMDIIRNQSVNIASLLASTTESLKVIELGAGDGSKIQHLLKSFSTFIPELEYVPLDISENILLKNKANLNEFLPQVQVQPVAGDYFQTYPEVVREKACRLVLFMGSNIGNYLLSEAIDFVRKLSAGLDEHDYILIAFDLVKDPRKILKAYDDSAGVTRAFNLNLLLRINRELGGNFDLDKFEHFPTYNPSTGITTSFLISQEKQECQLGTGETFYFEAYESIQTEVSKKYFREEISYLARESALQISRWFYNQDGSYAFVLFEK